MILVLYCVELWAKNMFYGAWKNRRVGGYYFVLMSSNATSGNMGGLSGANGICVTNLTANNFLGKDNVQINASTTRAWLCDATTCNNLQASRTYAFARAGSATAGGATFTTNASGQGPGNSNAWTGATYFNASPYLVTGRSSSSATLWGTTPSSATCSGWTSTGTTYQAGDAVATNAQRWTYNTPSCSAITGDRMVCIVEDPGG